MATVSNTISSKFSQVGSAHGFVIISTFVEQMTCQKNKTLVLREIDVRGVLI
jgi:hypothetical protein